MIGLHVCCVPEDREGVIMADVEAGWENKAGQDPDGVSDCQ